MLGNGPEVGKWAGRRSNWLMHEWNSEDCALLQKSQPIWKKNPDLFAVYFTFFIKAKIERRCSQSGALSACYKIFFSIIWLNKMKRILRSDWLSEARSCLLGISRVGPARKSPRFGHNNTKSFIDKACLVKMTEYWPRSVFRFYGLRRDNELGQ